MGLGKGYLPENLKVATFSRCRNITGEPQILGSSPSQGPRPLFSLGVIFMMGLGKPMFIPVSNGIKIIKIDQEMREL